MRLTRRAQLATGVALVTLAVFLPSVMNGFVTFDDDRNFTDNPAYRGLGPDQLGWMWTTFHTGHYVPLTWMTLGFDYELWGMNAAGYHLTSSVLHAIVAALAFLLADRLLTLSGATSTSTPGLTRWLPPVFAALAFSLHPLRVESVAWVTERRDVLSLLFGLGCLLAYVDHATREQGRRRSYWTSVALFACALLSKATVMTWPGVLLLLDVFPLARLHAGVSRQSPLRVLGEKVPFIVMATAAAVVSMRALPPRPQLPVAGKIAVSVYSLIAYLRTTLLPLRLSPLYPLPVRVDALAPGYLACAVAVVLITATVVALRRRWPVVLIAWGAFVLVSLPMLGAVQNGPQITADRYTYHAGLALTLVAAAALALVVRKHATGAVVISSVILALLAALTIHQTRVWKNSVSLWTRVVTLYPQSALAENGLGDAMQNDSTVAESARPAQMAAAIAHFRRAIAISPVDDEAHNNLAIALAMTGAMSEAMVHFSDAVRLNPSLETAHYNWGNALLANGELEEAAEHYRAALRLVPGDRDAANNLQVVEARLHAHE